MSSTYCGSRYRIVIVIVIVILALAAWILLDQSWLDVWSSRSFLMTGVGVTLFYSIIAVVLGLVFGGVLALMRLAGGLLGVISACVVTGTQALPAIFLISGVYLAIPELLPVKISPMYAAIIALTLISSSYYCEAFRGSFADVDKLQVEAGKITGLSRSIIFRRIVLPQALTSCLPTLGSISIVVFKLSTLLYPLGITDFFRTTVLVNNRIMAPVQCYALLAIFYYLAGDIMQYLLNSLSQRINSHQTRASTKSAIGILKVES